MAPPPTGSAAERRPLIRRAADSRRRARPGERPGEYQQSTEYIDAPGFHYDDCPKTDPRSVLVRRFCRTLAPKAQSLSFLLCPPLDDDLYYEETRLDGDEAWTCTFGTSENDGTWLNLGDRVGSLMAVIVWTLYAYAALTVLRLAQHGVCPVWIAATHVTVCALALACHAKTMLTDPGAVPAAAVPPAAALGAPQHVMCGLCGSYKPHGAHHCRICRRCVCRMDHHCPWVNNCVGVGNAKHFALFLLYTWLGAALALALFTANYFFCREDEASAASGAGQGASCAALGAVDLLLVRVMAVLCVGALLFTTTLLSAVVTGLLTGRGTIDRLKQRRRQRQALRDDFGDDDAEDAPPTPLTDVFGVGPRWLWPLPTDPDFEDYDRVMGYATRQQLLRQQQDTVSDSSTGVDGKAAHNGPHTTRRLNV